MADDSRTVPGTEEDLGEPIEALRDYEDAGDLGLVERVVRSLRRRTLSSHLATLWWSAMGQAFLEFLEIINSLFGSPDGDRGDSD